MWTDREPARRVFKFSDALTLHKSSVTLNLRSRPDGDVSISSALTAPVEHNPRLLYAAAKACSNDTTHRDGPSVLLAPFRASKTSAKTPARYAPVRFRQWACPPPRACPPVMCRQQPDALRGKIPVARPDTHRRFMPRGDTRLSARCTDARTRSVAACRGSAGAPMIAVPPDGPRRATAHPSELSLLSTHFDGLWECHHRGFRGH